MLSLPISSLKLGQKQNGCPHNFQARQGKSAVDNYTILWLPRSYLNGRPWYKNDNRSVWWDDTDKYWRIGDTTNKGGYFSYAKLDNDGRCLPKIPYQKWKLTDGSNWNDAGNKVKIKCGYKPEGKYKFLLNQM